LPRCAAACDARTPLQEKESERERERETAREIEARRGRGEIDLPSRPGSKPAAGALAPPPLRSVARLAATEQLAARVEG
jgi:hypothetical protein